MVVAAIEVVVDVEADVEVVIEEVVEFVVEPMEFVGLLPMKDVQM